MNLTFENVYTISLDVFKNEIIDLSTISFFDPWTIGMICLKAIENKDKDESNLILPSNINVKQYLKRMHLDKFLQELPCSFNCLNQFKEIDLEEHDTPNIQEILHCHFRDDFNARLESWIRRMFKNFGLNDNDEGFATAIVGELGNNVFDHNEGVWPTNVRGAIIIAQNYPKVKKIDVTVADPGVGFFGSLRSVEPNPPLTDIEAIKMGLRGITGRVGERRGDGLKIIQKWTINQLNGILRIHSGDGLVIVDKNGQEERSVNTIIGTLAEFIVSYN